MVSFCQTPAIWIFLSINKDGKLCFKIRAHLKHKEMYNYYLLTKGNEIHIKN